MEAPAKPSRLKVPDSGISWTLPSSNSNRPSTWKLSMSSGPPVRVPLSRHPNPNSSDCPIAAVWVTLITVFVEGVFLRPVARVGVAEGTREGGTVLSISLRAAANSKRE